MSSTRKTVRPLIYYMLTVNDIGYVSSSPKTFEFGPVLKITSFSDVAFLNNSLDFDLTFIPLGVV